MEKKPTRNPKPEAAPEVPKRPSPKKPARVPKAGARTAPAPAAAKADRASAGAGTAPPPGARRNKAPAPPKKATTDAKAAKMPKAPKTPKTPAAKAAPRKKEATKAMTEPSTPSPAPVPEPEPVPAEVMTQAFFYKHVVPANALTLLPEDRARFREEAARAASVPEDPTDSATAAPIAAADPGVAHAAMAAAGGPIGLVACRHKAVKNSRTESKAGLSMSRGISGPPSFARWPPAGASRQA